MHHRSSTLRLLTICFAFIILGWASRAEASPARAPATQGRKAKKPPKAAKSHHASKPKKETKKAKKNDHGFEF